MHLNSYLIQKQNMLIIVVTVNVLMSLPSLLKIQNRFDGDFNAYLNQAGAFLSGETFYHKVSSLEGPCFYPIVHLFIYSFHYLIHLATIYGEHISKLIVIGFNSG